MRVTLIYSAVGVAGFDDNRPIGDREGSWIGHGIASIGAATKAAGHDVALIDLRQLSGFDEFKRMIMRDPADVYGISVAPVDYAFALKTVFEIKSNLPRAKVIMGGIHPSIFPEEYDFEVIDTVVIGEGEVTFPELLNDIDNLQKVVQGTKPNLDEIPYADRELFDYQRELDCFFAPGQALPSITMISGRGCPFKCNYCQPAENAVFGKPYRMRSPEDVVNEMDLLYRNSYQFKSVTFWDDTFTVNSKWVDEFSDLYEMTGIGASIAACSRADLICNNEPMVERLASIGVDWFVIGLESGSQRLLDLIKKGTTVDQNIEAARICRKYGIKIFGTYMYGLPTETEEESFQTWKMINEIKPEHASPFWFLPIKGTGLYDICKKDDLILDEDPNIQRTGVFVPRLKGVNYENIQYLMGKENKDASLSV